MASRKISVRLQVEGGAFKAEMIETGRTTAVLPTKARITSLLNAPQVSSVRLHPGIANSWARRIAELRHFLDQEDTRTEATEIIRSLIEHVTIHPREDGSFEIELEGELTRMIEVSLEADCGPKNKKTTLADAERRSLILVAGARNPREFLLSCPI